MAKLIQMEGPLFEAVQLARIFKDSKTFVDAVPNGDPGMILRAFERERNASSFDLKTFVDEHFDLPQDARAKQLTQSGPSLEVYIDKLWSQLRREPEEAKANDTFIALNHPYILPHEHAREIRYWNSYFISLGLAEAGHLELVEAMVRNLIDLQEELAYIPSGNRHYLKTHSQPPVLSLLVRLLWDERYRDAEDGVAHIAEFLPALESEHRFWMTTARTVQLSDGTLLNRYWDDATTPRPELYFEDSELAQNSRFPGDLYQNLRAAAESGWTYSSRWLKAPGERASIGTTDFLPVDLNCLLYLLETSLVGYFGLLGNAEKQAYFLDAAETRKAAIQTLFWNEEAGFYFDYSWRNRKQTGLYSLAGVLPLYARIAETAQAERVKDKLMDSFLRRGGLVTSLSETGETWDSPNAQASLQWFAIVGLTHYGFIDKAKDLATRWLTMVRQHFGTSHTLFDSYNVITSSQSDKAPAASAQTAGVTLKLLGLYEEANQ